MKGKKVEAMPPIPASRAGAKAVAVKGKDDRTSAEQRVEKGQGGQVWPPSYWSSLRDGQRRTPQAHLYHGHVLSVLATLPAQSIHCCVTSPPYWGLRDYQADKKFEIGCERIPDCLGWTRGENCAERNWPESCFVCRMVLVFREVRRVLRDDGTLWLNLGDTYGGGSGGSATNSSKQQSNQGTMIQPRGGLKNLSPGNLVGVPWRVALALQADGWVLRQDLIWSKPSPMPESVKNRCTKAHEYIFLLTKSQRYYYDAEAIKEVADTAGAITPDRSETYRPINGSPKHGMVTPENRNKRSVWIVASQGYPGAHFATYPPKLITPCILAGTSERGCCAECGAPWKRLVEEIKLRRERPNEFTKRQRGTEGIGNTCANDVAGVEVKTVGWEPGCSCVGGVELGEDGYTEHPTSCDVVPCTVLDPFIGSGTTCAVSLELGRNSVGIDLSEKYLQDNAIPRIEGKLRALGRHDLVPRAKGTDDRRALNLGGYRTTC